MGAKGATPRPWQRLFEDADLAIVLLDRYGRIVFVNASAQVLLGEGSQDLLGLMCRRRPQVAGAEPLAALADVLSAPHAVDHGKFCQVRRRIPFSSRAVDLDFFPLSRGGSRWGIVVWLRPAGLPIDEPALGASAKLLELAGAADRRHDLKHFPAFSRVARRVADQIRLASRMDSPVLFRGEKGAGKSWLARALHQLSAGRDGTWLHLDCERLPPAALSRALRDCFAVADRQPAAIYLDQVMRLPRELQAEIASWRHAGGRSPRIMAGTDADPGAPEARDHLVEDFAEWLGLVEIGVPPLRQRAEDLPALLEQLARRLGHLDPGQDLQLVDTAKSLLIQYPWPGNLDEMLRIVEEIGPVTGTIEGARLPARLRRAVKMAELEPAAARRRVDLDQVLAEVERRLLKHALSRTRGNKSRAADLLGIWRARLIRRMQALGMSVDDDDPANGGERPDDSTGVEPECAPDN
jgi:transcriptional regulator with PAS, ATPase and Fis domain